jgi:hypothetical protein
MRVSELITELSAFDNTLSVQVDDGGLLPLFIYDHATPSTHKELLAGDTVSPPYFPAKVGNVIDLLQFANPSSHITINVGGSIKDVGGVELQGDIVIIEARKWFVLRSNEIYLM